MPTLYDARGNEILGLFPDRLNGQVQTDGRTATNVLAALNAEVLVDCDGMNTISADIRTGAASLSFVFEGMLDGVNYFTPLDAFAIDVVAGAGSFSEQFVGTLVITTTLTSRYVINCAGYKRVRVRVAAYTSGNITVAMRASGAQAMSYVKPVPTILWVTATAAANAAATATLPAAGVGLFHYITHINITRNATAALAGTATIIHTTTNLPGNPAWSVGNAMIAGGTQRDVDLYLAGNPLKSLAANINTTVVAAAGGAAVLGRVNVGYYVGK